MAVLQQHLNGWSVFADAVAADVNNDNKVNMMDLALLQQHLNGWNITLK